MIHELTPLLAFRPRPFAITSPAGLSPQPPRSANGYRVYAPPDVERLRFIAGHALLGFSLDDINEALGLRDRGEAPCRYMLDLIEREAAQIDQRIADLQQLKGELTTLLRNAQGLPLDDVEGKACVCHLVQNQQRVAGQDQASRSL